jgi:Putative endonuclease, protein of unknown function (DUF1780)
VTHGEFEALWLDALRADADDTIDLLRNRRKQERERRTCAAFLRCAGIAFEPDKLIGSTTEPPDVLFGPARFEVAIVLPRQRLMNDEWKDTARRRAEAQNIQDLIEPFHPPEDLTRQEVIDLISPHAETKKQKYRARRVSTADLDLLLYVNQNVALNVETPSPNCEALVRQGWRSVSLIIPPHSYVVLADNTAPEFISGSVEKPTAGWNRPGLCGLFDI